jgi:hypothetical protein
MSLAQIYSAVSGDTITSARWNNEFGNIYNNGTDIPFPLTKAVSFAGYTVTVDAVGVTTITSPANSGFLFTVGAKSGAGGANGSLATITASTFTDSSTLAVGTAALWTGVSIRTPTLAATNLTVTTTDAATVYVEGPPTAGANQTLTNPWAILAASGKTKLGGDLLVSTSDSRTNTVAVPVTIASVTSGSAAAGIGTGVKFQAESADEPTSDFGQLEFGASDVTAGSEDTYLQILTRTAGAALAAIWKIAGTTAFKGTITQGNSADRIYTFPDVDGTVVFKDSTDTLTNKTLTSPTITGNTLGTGTLKTATGSVNANNVDPTATITLNDYAFTPNIQNTGGNKAVVQAFVGADSSTTVGRFQLINETPGAGSFNYVVRWRYVTASDNPTMWIAYDIDGTVKAVWVADDPLPDGLEGVTVSGCTSILVKASDLESMTVLNAKADDAMAYIQENKLKEANQAYRSLQLVAQDVAPSKWLLDNCVVTKGKLETKVGK